LIFGGDEMLGRSCATKMENGTDPFEGIATLLRDASFAVANLECTISNLGETTHHYAFRAPARSAHLLRRAGFHAMGLANNHALDFGATALHDCAAQLLQENIEPIGVKTLTDKACVPGFFSVRDGNKIAVPAINAFDTSSELGSTSDRAELKLAIGNARSHADLIVCLAALGNLKQRTNH
jgi:poly-gamma-glutamate capsule biosynthesis protein CapA/YwtB (metallophosphatase superfamily)